MFNKIQKKVSLNNKLKILKSKNFSKSHFFNNNNLKNKKKSYLYLVKKRHGYKFYNQKNNKYNKHFHFRKKKDILQFNFKFLKNVKHVFKPKSFLNSKAVESKVLSNLLRYITFYKTYKIRNKFFFYLNGKLKQFNKKKNKKNLKIKLFLWKSLTLINNVKDKLNIDVNNWNKFNLKTKNYYNFKKGKKVPWKIFTNFSKLFRNRYNIVGEKNKAYCVKKGDLLLDEFYLLRKCNLDYYKKYFIINYNYNYFLFFYNVIKSNIVLKIVDKLELKNYISYEVLNKRKIKFRFKANKLYYIDYNNNSFSKIKMAAVLNKFAKQNDSWNKFLMRHKKWNRNSIYSLTLLLLKKMVSINAKINIHFNDQSFLHLLTNRKQYKHFYSAGRNVILDENNLKIPKYWILFFNYLKKSFVLKNNIAKKYKFTTLYNLKKYYFFFNFIKHYLLKLFNCLKYIFFLKKNNIQFYMYKLKFIMFMMFYKSFYKNLKLKKKKKILKRVIKLRNNVFLLKKAKKFLFYNYILRSYKSKIKKMWYLKMKDPVLNMIKEEGTYIQPFLHFKYNPKLNKRHKIE